MRMQGGEEADDQDSAEQAAAQLIADPAKDNDEEGEEGSENDENDPGDEEYSPNTMAPLGTKRPTPGELRLRARLAFCKVECKRLKAIYPHLNYRQRVEMALVTWREDYLEEYKDK